MVLDEREVLFANEAFAISVLQAVSGGALIATLAQSDAISDLGGDFALIMFLTLTALALAAALFAAFCRHQYKLWDVKGAVSAAKGRDDKAVRRGERATRYFKWVRSSLWVSVCSMIFGLVLLIASFWYGYFNPPLSLPEDCIPTNDVRSLRI